MEWEERFRRAGEVEAALDFSFRDLGVGSMSVVPELCTALLTVCTTLPMVAPTVLAMSVRNGDGLDFADFFLFIIILKLCDLEIGSLAPKFTIHKSHVIEIMAT